MRQNLPMWHYLFSLGFNLPGNITVPHDSLYKLKHSCASLTDALHLLKTCLEILQEAWPEETTKTTTLAYYLSNQKAPVIHWAFWWQVWSWSHLTFNSPDLVVIYRVRVHLHKWTQEISLWHHSFGCLPANLFVAAYHKDAFTNHLHLFGWLCKRSGQWPRWPSGQWSQTEKHRKSWWTLWSGAKSCPWVTDQHKLHIINHFKSSKTMHFLYPVQVFFYGCLHHSQFICSLLFFIYTQNNNKSLFKKKTLPDLCDIRFFEVLQGQAGSL